MRREFAVVLRDSEGAFLEADRVFGELGLDIMRVSYNKIVDVHTCFVEVEGTAEALAAAERRLMELGLFPTQSRVGTVRLVEFEMPNAPGALRPALELIVGSGTKVHREQERTAAGLLTDGLRLRLPVPRRVKRREGSHLLLRGRPVRRLFRVPEVQFHIGRSHALTSLCPECLQSRRTVFHVVSIPQKNSPPKWRAAGFIHLMRPSFFIALMIRLAICW